ncbi:MAG: SDR family NAD(P)-dependent oxidoreductase [Lachnospiraceae bacterium]|nr:SDR family NAD(P)-dependent oxidoreductase [Lachnospiraceae bacterium]
MGKDFVRELQKEKNIDEIWMIARREERLKTMEAKGKGKLRAFTMDLTDIEIFHVLETVLKNENPQIQYLVNAAGTGRMGKIENIDYENHAFVLDINVRALTCMTRVCLPYMQKGSRIIQLCSGSAFLPQPEFASYAASKAYVLSFSRALRQEVKGKGITVTAVCPGPVNTEFFEAAGSEIAPAKKRFLVESKDVVRKALKDAKSGKELSIYGISMKLVHLAGKILPTRVVLSVMNEMMTNTHKEEKNK